MTTYKRKKDRDTWHWCKNCSNWPKTQPYVEKTLSGKQRPTTGELCDQCLAKEGKGDCDTA